VILQAVLVKNLGFGLAYIDRFEPTIMINDKITDIGEMLLAILKEVELKTDILIIISQEPQKLKLLVKDVIEQEELVIKLSDVYVYTVQELHKDSSVLANHNLMVSTLEGNNDEYNRHKNLVHKFIG